MFHDDLRFTKMIDVTLQLEGGYVNDPRDSGGETIWGITLTVARAFGYRGMMSNMTRDEAKEIYYRRYWLPLYLPNIAQLSMPIAEELFDTAVNQGQTTAGKYLQRSLNVLNLNGAMYRDTTVDGQIGPMTFAALREYLNRRKQAGELVLLRMLNSLQGAAYVELAERRAKDEAFVFGWFANRVV
jgi:lysozyme family protein